jgi:hypothetical protein
VFGYHEVFHALASIHRVNSGRVRRANAKGAP